MKGKSPLRSLPRPSGQHKGGKKGGKRGAAAAQATWDHDRSDDESSAEQNKSSGRKRQRVESDDEEAVHRLSDGDADASSSEDENDEGKQAAAAQEADVSGASESEAEDVDSQDEAAEGDKGGGMGDVMARILGQQLTTESAPVLAKRRTKAMKEMEAESERKAAAVARRAERRAQQTQQLHIPDASTMEHERQLKKIATRGVVALFNAITQQRQAERSGDAPAASTSSNGKRKGDGSRAVKDLTKSTFLDMLKSGKSAEGKKGAKGSSSSSSSSVVAPPARGASVDDSAQWSVLKDDYLIGSKNMKDWDKDSDDDASADDAGVRALGEDSGDDE